MAREIFVIQKGLDAWKTLKILPRFSVDLLHGRYPSLLSRPSRVACVVSFTLHPCSDKIFSTDSDDDEADDEDDGDS